MAARFALASVVFPGVRQWGRLGPPEARGRLGPCFRPACGAA